LSSIRKSSTSTWASSGTHSGRRRRSVHRLGITDDHPSTPCLDPPAARNESGYTGRPHAVAEVRLARSLIRLVTSLIPRPIRMNSTPIRIAIAAAPKATTEVNREAWRNEAV
jgi:hypothetical protein